MIIIYRLGCTSDIRKNYFNKTYNNMAPTRVRITNTNIVKITVKVFNAYAVRWQ